MNVAKTTRIILMIAVSVFSVYAFAEGEDNAVLMQLRKALGQQHRPAPSAPSMKTQLAQQGSVIPSINEPSHQGVAPLTQEQHPRPRTREEAEHLSDSQATRVLADDPAFLEHAVGQINPTKAMREVAFQSLVNQFMPMTPQQIVALRRVYDESQLAAVTTPKPPPKPVSGSLVVNLSPGSDPAVIRLAAGFVSTLLFVDSTGAPWPIQSYDLGNPGAFNIQWNSQDNTLYIQPSTLYTYANMVVKLRGLSTPVLITLIPGQKVVDYRVDLRIPGLGPNAKYIPLGNGLPPQANPQLLSLLDGVPPSGSKSLQVSGGNAQAWIMGESLLLRTSYTVISPSWLAKMSSPDGTNAYQLPVTPIILASAHGKVVQLKIEGY